MPIPDHPLRYATVNELHARPFPSLEVPSTAVYVAIKEPVQAQNRDRGKDLAHLLGLLDRGDRAFRRFKQPSLPKQRGYLGARVGPHFQPGNARHRFMSIFPIGLGRGGEAEHGGLHRPRR